MLARRPDPARSRAQRWRSINADAIAGRAPGPEPPAEWAPALKQLVDAARIPQPPPRWWTIESAFYGNVETRTDPRSYVWDGLKRPADPRRPHFIFQFTLAGMGHFEWADGSLQPVPPGTGFFAIIPSAHRYYLPERSEGWTFGWIGVHHPYVVERVSDCVRTNGPVLRIPHGSAFAAIAVRLVQSAFRKDFRDRFEAESTLFDFLFAYERLVHSVSYPPDERERLLDELRTHVLANLGRPIGVESLARRRGMSRSHFSHYFKAKTGLTPAWFMTEVRVHEAARRLLSTNTPLKEIAAALGFANVNHFGKVFRRFQHLSPSVYRRTQV
jgi:AraC-like DNA-binding protein